MPKLKSKKAKTDSKTPAARQAETREVVYEEIIAVVCEGETAITAQDARETLGWEDVSEVGGTYVREIYSLTKMKVRLNNNVTNRPIYTAVVLALKQEILRKRWCLNGEPIIVGHTGLVLNGQHQLIALVLADLEWQKDKDHWHEWETSPTINKVVVSGIDESDSTVNTMDTCKPRSLADVIYRSEFFAVLPSRERRAAANVTGNAIKLLWHRTGAFADAFAPRRTHAESLDFVARHPKLLDAVKHVMEEDGKEHRLSRYTTPGYAAGLMYLMGSSASDPEQYRFAEHPNETMLDWSRWSQAADFMVLLAAGGDESKAVRAAMADSLEEGGLSNAERWGILANAWLAHLDGGTIDRESLVLQYETDDDGVRHLIEQPSVGGIDLGDMNTADEATIAASDPAPEAIAEEAAKVRRGNKHDEEPAKPKPVKLTTPHRASTNWRKGDVAWVADSDGEHYLGQLTEDPWDCDDKSCLTMVIDSKGHEWEVSYASLSLERPETGGPSDKKAIHFPKPRPHAKDNGPEHKVGDLRWVRDRGGEHWRGKIIELSKNGAKLKVSQGFAGAGNVKMAWMKELSKDQPQMA